MRCLYTAIGLAAFALPIAGAEPTTVGELAAPDHIVFHGQEAFSAQALRTALTGDLAYQLFADPQTPREAFLSVIRERLREGYGHSGFPDAKIHVAVDEARSQVLVSLKEGPRYRNGNVRIVGADEVSSEKLIAWCTRRRPPHGALPRDEGEGNLPVWTDKHGKRVSLEAPLFPAGEILRSSQADVARTAKIVKQGFQKQGFYEADFDVRFVKHADSRTADLEIRVNNEGARARIHSIRLRGNERHTRQEILESLGLRPGISYHAELEAQILGRLWRSGRFLTHSVSIESPIAPDAPVELRIDVIENPDAPPLGEEPTRVEATLLKFGKWLTRWADSDECLRVAIRSHPETGGPPDVTGEVLLKPSRGIIIDADVSPEAVNPLRLRQTLLIDGSRLVLASPSEHARWDVGSWEGGGFISTVDVAGKKPDGEGRKYWLLYGLGARSEEDEGFRMKISVAPTNCFGWAHLKNAKYRFAEGQLHIEGPLYAARIEESTGRLIQYRIGKKTGSGERTIRIVPGEFDQRAKALKAKLGGYTNAFRADSPVSSAAAYFLTTAASSIPKDADGDVRETLALLSRLATEGALKPIDQFVLERGSSSERWFSIPADGSTFTRRMAGSGMSMNARLFPYGSTYWSAGRELAVLVGGERDRARRGIGRLSASPDLGPVGALYASSLFGLVSKPLASSFAEIGRKRLDGAGFRKDYRPLLDSETAAGNLLAALGESVRGLDKQGVARLTGYLADPQARAKLTAAIAKFQKDGRPVRQSLPDLLDAAWETALKDLIEQALRHYARDEAPRVTLR